MSYQMWYVRQHPGLKEGQTCEKATTVKARIATHFIIVALPALSSVPGT